MVKANTLNIADDFYQAVLDIITKSYEKHLTLSTISHNSDVRQHERIMRLKMALEVWEKDGTQWPHPAYDKGKPTDAYKSAIMSNFKETFDAFSEVLEHSSIFSEEEKQEKNGVYQDTITVLKTPINPQKKEEDELNKGGLFYEDMEHNDRYWDMSGSHIQLAQNLSEILISILNISQSEYLEEKKEDLQNALSTIFTKELYAYGVCPGGHSDNIRDANDFLAISPEDVLLSNWHGYIKFLIQEDVNIAPNVNTTIINGIPEGEQRHLPPAIDYLSGVSKDIIVKKDSTMHNGHNGLGTAQLSFLIDKVFDFPKSLSKRLSSEIDNVLQDFDELDLVNKNDRVKKLCNIIIGQYDKNTKSNDFKYSLWIEDLSTFKDASTIKEMAEKRFCFLMGAITGIDGITMKTLSDSDVSVKKRIECIPKELSFFHSLFLIYAFKGDTEALEIIKDACPDNLKPSMFLKALQYCAFLNNQSAFDIINDACPDNLKKDLFTSLMVSCASEENQEVLNMVKATCPDGLLATMFANAFYYCALQNNNRALDMLQAACPDGVKNTMFNVGLKLCAINQKQGALNMVTAACPDDLKKSMFQSTLLNCALENNQAAFDMVQAACSDELKNSMYIPISSFCASKNNQGAFDMVEAACPDNLKQIMFAFLLLDFASRNNQVAFDMVQAACPDNLKQSIFSNVLLVCALEKNQPAVNMLQAAFPEDLLKDIYSSALLNCDIDKNQEAVDIIKTSRLEAFKNSTTSLNNRKRIREKIAKKKQLQKIKGQVNFVGSKF